MLARIYRPAKTAMQSGRANTRKWLLDYEPDDARTLDPLMGWTGSGDTRRQVRLTFESLDEAVAYAKRNKIPYQVAPEHERKPKFRTYAENFR